MCVAAGLGAYGDVSGSGADFLGLSLALFLGIPCFAFACCGMYIGFSTRQRGMLARTSNRGSLVAVGLGFLAIAAILAVVILVIIGPGFAVGPNE